MSRIRVGDTKLTYRGLNEMNAQLGAVVQDDAGCLWRVSRAKVAIAAGLVVKDAAAVFSGVPSTQVEVGDKTLISTGSFTSAADLYKGALFQTLGTLANGAGQRGYVKEKVDVDTLSLFFEEAFSGGTLNQLDTGSGASVAVTTSGVFQIVQPGYVDLATDGRIPTGVAPVAVSATTNPYFYARLTGPQMVMVDESDNDLVFNQLVTVSPTTDGYVEGPDASGVPTATELASAIGRVMTGGVTTDDYPVLIDLDIPVPARSRLRYFLDNPLQTVDI